MQIGFYFDQTKCIGCFACVVSCKDWYDIQEKEISRIRLLTLENGKFPDVSVKFIVQNCLHCAEPACMEVCPNSAISKREDNGIVLIDDDKCVGEDECGLCRQACPYEIPQFGSSLDAKAQKCNLCVDRWAENKKPVCVEACLVDALDAGFMDDLKSKYGVNNSAAGFAYNSELQPSVIFKSEV